MQEFDAKKQPNEGSPAEGECLGFGGSTGEMSEKEHDAREIRIGVSWHDLLETNGFKIPDTACRAITLDQLRKVLDHSKRRLAWIERCIWPSERSEREKWSIWTPDDPNFQISSVDQVIWIRLSPTGNYLRQVNLYALNKYVILPATVKSKWSLVEVSVVMQYSLVPFGCLYCYYLRR